MPTESAAQKRPGSSRLRQAEGVLKDNGVLVVPDDWDIEWVRKWLADVKQIRTRAIQQYRLEQTYTEVHPDPMTRVMLPGPVVRLLVVEP